MATFFSDFFNVDEGDLENYGAFNISLINDLPLFIDPFLLFGSKDKNYQKLHTDIIDYLIFLKGKSHRGTLSEDLLKAWYCFPEVKQNWLGFSENGNGGAGLGLDFAKSLNAGLHDIFTDFGTEKVTLGSHIEKVCLIKDGVGRDNVSDFTTNLIKDYLCEYTTLFARKYIDKSLVKIVKVQKAKFDYDLEAWKPEEYMLPFINGDFVILTPKNILTRDENWINRHDLIKSYYEIAPSIGDDALRGQISNYFEKVLVKHNDKESSRREHDEAAANTILQFPQLIDLYIRLKEDRADSAKSVSEEKVSETEQVFINHLKILQSLLSKTEFYKTSASTHDEAHKRVAYLKNVIEKNGGYRIFYHNGIAIQREKDLQILYKLVWYGTPSDVTAEANDGKGPVDYKISRGSEDKTLVEMKLAKNTQLERNLQKQVEIYKAASNANNSIKVILFFTEEEHAKVESILIRLKLNTNPDVVLIDARSDNKPSGSKA